MPLEGQQYGSACVAPWVERPTLGFGSGPDVRVVRSSPAMGSELGAVCLKILSLLHLTFLCIRVCLCALFLSNK